MNTLDDVISQVSSKVAREYPAMKGVKPSVRQQADLSGKAGEGLWVLTYKTQVTLENGLKMPQCVRVVASKNGTVKKMSLSK